MNHNSKRQHHELARKHHRQELLKHARDVARKQPSTAPRWLLGISLTCIFIFLVFVVIRATVG
jgi:hypothetical protein